MKIVIATFSFQEVRTWPHRVVCRINIENFSLAQRTNRNCIERCTSIKHRHYNINYSSLTNENKKINSAVRIVFFHFESNQIEQLSYYLKFRIELNSYRWSQISKVTSSKYWSNKFNCFYGTAPMWLQEFQYLVGHNGPMLGVVAKVKNRRHSVK